MERRIAISVLAGLLAGAVGTASGQEPARHGHAPGMTPDPATDWSKVNPETLR